MKNFLYYLLFTFVFVGCGDGSGGSSSTPVVINDTAYLIDAPVSGVEYSCGDISGLTGVDGSFTFNNSCKLQFKVGNVVIGKLPGALVAEDKYLFPADIAQVARGNVNDEVVVKIIQLLQSLDEDKDNSVIHISENSRIALLDVEEINLQDHNVGTDELENILISIGEELVPRDDAINHYRATLENDYNIDIIEFNIPIPNPSLYASGSIDENATAGMVVGNIPVEYLGNGDVSSIVLVGDGAELFVARNNGDIVLADDAILDYEDVNTYRLTAAITDVNDVLSGASFMVRVHDVEESIPTILPFSAEIAEDATAGTILGIVTVTDDGNTAITSMTLSGEDASKFLVNKNGLIYVAAGASFDYETKAVYNLNIIATNNVGNSNSVSVTVNITDVQEPPVLTPFTGSVEENSPEGTVVGSIAVDSGGSAVTSIVLSGTGSKNFIVSTNGTITVSSEAALDYETTTSYSLNAIARNADGNSNSVSVNINILDVAETVTTNPFNTFKIVASDGEVNDNFGLSNYFNGNVLSISGDYVAVGVPNKSSAQGVVYVYKKQLNGTLSELAKLTASDATSSSEYFGSSVSIDGNYIAIGARSKDVNGSAYIFKNNGSDIFNEIDKINDINGSNNAGFGNTIAISGGYIIVGAAESDINGSGSGLALLFQNDGNDNFNLVKKITPSDAEESKYFGNSVSIDGDNIVIGANGTRNNTSVRGKVYIYKTTDNTEKVLEPSDIEDYDQFGFSVSVYGNYIVAGSINDDDNGSNSGSAYIFEKDGNGTEISKLTAFDADANDQFGFSVSISGDNILIGARSENSSSGAAYLFRNDGSGVFSEVSKLTTLDISASDEFGSNVFISGDDMVVSSPQDDDVGLDSGSAYFYTMQVETRPYLINYATSIKVDEGNTTVKDYFSDSINGTPITYSPSSTDAGLFSIDGNGLLTFDNAPDYEVPSDDNIDNNYTIDITITDQSNQTYTYPVNVEVIDTISATEVSKLLAIDANTSDEFGYKVDISEDYLVIGAYKDDNDTGAVYVYKNDGSGNYIHHNKLVASDADLDDKFGYSVAINGDYIVIGGPINNDNGSNTGSAYIFKKDGSGDFIEQTKLLPSDSSSEQRFGYDVDITTTKIAISGLDTDDMGVAVYIYDLDGSNEVKIDNPDSNNGFGYSIAIDMDNVVVGAITNNLNGSVTRSGALYVYKTDGTLITKLEASDASSDDELGNDVDISGNYIVAGASSAGAVYIFKNNGSDNYTQEPKISGSSSYAFGTSVSIDANYLLIGSPLFDVDDGYGYQTSGAGKIDLYKKTISNYEYKLSIYASDFEENDYFGTSVAIDFIDINKSNIVIGSPYNDDNGTDSGSAYHFKLVD